MLCSEDLQQRVEERLSRAKEIVRSAQRLRMHVHHCATMISNPAAGIEQAFRARSSEERFSAICGLANQAGEHAGNLAGIAVDVIKNVGCDIKSEERKHATDFAMGTGDLIGGTTVAKLLSTHPEDQTEVEELPEGVGQGAAGVAGVAQGGDRREGDKHDAEQKAISGGVQVAGAVMDVLGAKRGDKEKAQKIIEGIGHVGAGITGIADGNGRVEGKRRAQQHAVLGSGQLAAAALGWLGASESEQQRVSQATESVGSIILGRQGHPAPGDGEERAQGDDMIRGVGQALGGLLAGRGRGR